jgi:hypothetical protein|nr:MAG TPA_asm: pentapeptide repeat protein [Caudoviricetes sp.]
MSEKNFNTGKFNTGYSNTGSYNAGDRNTGGYNPGNSNTGFYNIGNCNTGSYNAGDCNTGDWNKTSFSTGCFNTNEQNITLFNKPSTWKYSDWICSDARNILNTMPTVDWLDRDKIYDNSEEHNSECKVTGEYILNKYNTRQLWWNRLPGQCKDIIEAIPNFDPCIFFKCTGIKVDEE